MNVLGFMYLYIKNSFESKLFFIYIWSHFLDKRFQIRLGDVLKSAKIFNPENLCKFFIYTVSILIESHIPANNTVYFLIACLYIFMEKLHFVTKSLKKLHFIYLFLKFYWLILSNFCIERFFSFCCVN